MFVFKRKGNIWISWISFFLFTFIFFFNSIKELLSRWFTTGEYYSQGPFIFIVFFWILLKRYRSTAVIERNDSVSGIFFILTALSAEVFGLYVSILTFQFFAIYLFILGCSFFLLGKKFVFSNISLFLYLLLAIPLPSFLLDYLTFHLKFAAADISGFFLSIIYPSTVLTGSTLNINNYLIEITPACSGMENIFGMVSLLWSFALFQKRKLIAALDYIISIPAAILSNISRILIVSVLTVNGYGKFALKDFHETIGVIVFIIIFILISLFNEWPDSKADCVIKKADDYPNSSQKKKIYAILVIMAIMSAGTLAFQLRKGRVEEEKSPSFINSIAAETPKWGSRDEKIEDYYFSMLKTNDILMREYYKKNDKSGEESVYLFFVHAKGDRSPFLHRPELCITGDGYNLLNHKVIKLPSTGRPVSRMMFARGEKGLLVYYWYSYNGKDLDSYLNLQFDLLTGQIKKMDCSMIRLSTIVDPLNVEKGEILLQEFAEKEIPLIFNSH